MNEMQITLAKETLSKCLGNTEVIKEKILPRRNRNRRQRMTNFLRFILQDDQRVLEFEKMLTSNGLQKLLISEKSVQEDHIANDDIGRFKHVTIAVMCFRVFFCVIFFFFRESEPRSVNKITRIKVIVNI